MLSNLINRFKIFLDEELVFCEVNVFEGDEYVGEVGCVEKRRR